MKGVRKKIEPSIPIKLLVKAVIMVERGIKTIEENILIFIADVDDSDRSFRINNPSSDSSTVQLDLGSSFWLWSDIFDASIFIFFKELIEL